MDDGNHASLERTSCHLREYHSLCAYPTAPPQCIIGDAIVWWRVCVIWRNKVVYYIGPILVSLTVGKHQVLVLSYGRPSSDTRTVFGIIGYREPKIAQSTRVTLLITNNAFVKAAAAVSFSTNALATALTAYKMWCVL